MENSDTIILPELSMFFSTMFSQSGDGQSALLPCLHAAQDLYGYIPEKAIDEISKNLQIPVEKIVEVINYFPLFFTKPVNKTILHVCNDPTCKLAGADAVFRMIHNSELGKTVPGETPIEKAPCLGLCVHTPSVYMDNGMFRIPVEKRIQNRNGSGTVHSKTTIRGENRLITHRCGTGKTTGLMEYWSSEGYQALKKALSMSGENVISEIKTSGLTGRGGESLMTGIKWEKAFQSEQKSRYMVCNASESDPMSYKDRVLMEDDPHSLLEGMIIAAYAIRAAQGFLHINGEYDTAYQALSKAIIDAREAGLLGKKILGTEFNFDIELRRGAGRYVCGEETAILEAIEGKCGIPRKKPPFPTSIGLFGKPTVINNVETLCNVPVILRMEARNYKKIGTETSKGTVLLSMMGDLVNPGLLEIPFGLTFRQLIFEICGGISTNHIFQAAIVGGVTGKLIDEKELDIPISHEYLRKAGITLRGGSIIVLDDSRNLINILCRISKFLAIESCGICPSCVNGTRTQFELLNKAKSKQISAEDLQHFREILHMMEKTSICRLGKTAAHLARSAYQKWPDLFS